MKPHSHIGISISNFKFSNHIKAKRPSEVIKSDNDNLRNFRTQFNVLEFGCCCYCLKIIDNVSICIFVIHRRKLAAILSYLPLWPLWFQISYPEIELSCLHFDLLVVIGFSQFCFTQILKYFQSSVSSSLKMSHWWWKRVKLHILIGKTGVYWTVIMHSWALSC